jgi:hypothetical protein
MVRAESSQTDPKLELETLSRVKTVQISHVCGPQRSAQRSLEIFATRKYFLVGYKDFLLTIFYMDLWAAKISLRAVKI